MELWNCFSCFQVTIFDDLGFMWQSREDNYICMTLLQKEEFTTEARRTQKNPYFYLE